MEKKKKQLELVLRYGDFEAAYPFENMGDYEEAVADLTAYCGIPVDAELVTILEQELLMRALGRESTAQLLDQNLLFDFSSPLFRGLAAKLVESLRPLMKPTEISGGIPTHRLPYFTRLADGTVVPTKK